MEYKNFETVTMSLERYIDILEDRKTLEKNMDDLWDNISSQSETISELKHDIQELKKALLIIADKGKNHYYLVRNNNQLLDHEFDWGYGLKNYQLLSKCGITDEEMEDFIKSKIVEYECSKEESDESTTSEA